MNLFFEHGARAAVQKPSTTKSWWGKLIPARRDKSEATRTVTESLHRLYRLFEVATLGIALVALALPIVADHLKESVSIGHAQKILEFLHGVFFVYLSILTGALSFWVSRILKRLSRENAIQLQQYQRETQQVVNRYLDASISAIGCVRPLLSLTRTLDLATEITPTDSSGSAHLQKEVERARILLPAVQSNFQAWDKRISQRKNDDALLPVWDRCLETYFLEEAYDVNRGELVTNARNLPSLLLTITEALLGTVRQRRERGEHCILHYYAFTPVEPKDWLNWPHGQAGTHAYYENWFIGLYYRALAQMLLSPTAKEILMHGRFVLCHKGNENKQDVNNGDRAFNGPFRGWKLVEREVLERSLEEWWVFPAAVSMASLEHSKIAPKCYEYFNQSFLRANLTKPDPHLVVPVYRKNGLGAGVGTVTEFEKSWTSWCNDAGSLIPDSFCKLRELAVSDAKTVAFYAAIKQIVDQVSGASSLWECLLKAIDGKDVCLFMRTMHELDAKLAAAGKYETPHAGLLTTDLLGFWLRTISAERVPKSEWQSLGSWFSTELHSSPDLAQLLEFNEERYRWWTEEPPVLDEEFAIWGIGPPKGPVDWKLMLSASLSQPFEATRLRLADSCAPASDMLEKAEKVVSAVTGLPSNKPHINEWVRSDWMKFSSSVAPLCGREKVDSVG